MDKNSWKELKDDLKIEHQVEHLILFFLKDHSGVGLDHLHLEPQVYSNQFFFMDGKRETTISYVKMWFIIQLEQPFIDGCLGYQIEEIRRYLCSSCRRIAIPPPLASKLVETWTSQKNVFLWIFRESNWKGEDVKYILAWKLKQASLLVTCFSWMIPNVYMKTWVFHHFHPLKKMVVWSSRPEDDNLREGSLNQSWCEGNRRPPPPTPDIPGRKGNCSPPILKKRKLRWTNQLSWHGTWEYIHLEFRNIIFPKISEIIKNIRFCVNLRGCNIVKCRIHLKGRSETPMSSQPYFCSKKTSFFLTKVLRIFAYAQGQTCWKGFREGYVLVFEKQWWQVVLRKTGSNLSSLHLALLRLWPFLGC